jgi:carbamoylphosphate synthase large subunit
MSFENAGIKIPAIFPRMLEIANNKSRLYEFMEWRGITVPAFRIVETVRPIQSCRQ